MNEDKPLADQPRKTPTKKKIPPLSIDALTQHKIEQAELEGKWRRTAASGILNMFYFVNGFVILFLFAVWLGPLWTSTMPKIVTERVLLALIAGSTTQLGALALFVGRSLASPKG